jgi:hypothetical protein
MTEVIVRSNTTGYDIYMDGIFVTHATATEGVLHIGIDPDNVTVDNLEAVWEAGYQEGYSGGIEFAEGDAYTAGFEDACEKVISAVKELR